MADPVTLAMREKKLLPLAQEEALNWPLTLQMGRTFPTTPSPEFRSATLFPTAFLSKEKYLSTSSCGDESHTECLHSLGDTDQQLKSTLTDLLNAEPIRLDSGCRAWILDQLMDTEKRIRKQRHRCLDRYRNVAELIVAQFRPV